MIARRFLSASLVVGLLAIPAFAPPVGAKTKKTTAKTAAKKPADATGQCDDGTYTKAKTQQGACSSHGGVKTWYGEPPAAAATAPTKESSSVRAPKPARTSKTAPAPPVTTSAPAAPPVTTAPATKPATTAPAAGTPANATAKCKDGTFSYAKQHSGACSHHGGVAEWYK
jgi:hypothetical protein